MRGITRIFSHGAFSITLGILQAGIPPKDTSFWSCSIKDPLYDRLAYLNSSGMQTHPDEHYKVSR